MNSELNKCISTEKDVTGTKVFKGMDKLPSQKEAIVSKD
jgi:hypothetical protein